MRMNIYMKLMRYQERGDDDEDGVGGGGGGDDASPRQNCPVKFLLRRDSENTRLLRLDSGSTRC